MFSTKSSYDIVVVGGGPGGALAAWKAAEQGVNVLMIEKDREIGLPVRCAEAIGADVVHRYLEKDPRWISHELHGARFFAPSGDSVEFSLDSLGSGYILERNVFDRELANQAARAGADIRVSTCATGLVYDQDRLAGVKMNTRDEEYTVPCKIVIAADGVESRVARWAGLNTMIALRDLEVTTQYLMDNVTTDKGYFEFYLGKEVAPGGYLWIFPKGPNTANVGIGVCGRYTRRQSSTAYLDAFVEKHLPNSTPLGMVVGSVPVAHTLDDIVTDGLMIVGDAARMVNPSTGGGIAQAMTSGEIAGKIAGEAIKKGDVSKEELFRYRKAWDKRYGNLQKRIYGLKEAFHKVPDEDFNRTAALFKNKKHVHVFELLTKLLIHQPGMILNFMRAFAGR